MSSKFNNLSLSASATNVNAKLNLLLCCAGFSTKERMKCLLLELTSLSNIFHEFHIRVIVTNKSSSVYKDSSISNLVEVIYTDEDEWTQWKKIGDPVLHIELTKWADVLLIAPMDLECVSKIATGICDDLLTCTLRAWNLKKPIIFYPTVSSTVRNQNITRKHLSTLYSWGYKEISPTINSEVSSAGRYPTFIPSEINSMIISIMEKE